MTLETRVLFGVLVSVGVMMAIAGLRGLVLLDRLRLPARSSNGMDEREVVEALAVWTEQLRDTMAGASGIEQAITVTADTAPPLLKPAVEELAARLGFETLPNAVREFTDDVDHPLADFVGAALITAAENQVREMGSLLSHLAQCCRDDVAMRTRIWVARARTRSAVRIISVVVVLFVVGLVLLDPQYLSPYSTPTGMGVAAVIAAMFAAAFSSMKRLGRIEITERFVARREVSGR